MAENKLNNLTEKEDQDLTNLKSKQTQDMLAKKEHDKILYDKLNELCKNNIEFFKNDETPHGQRIHGAFIGLIDHILRSMPLINDVNKFSHEYDFDEDTPGNGYRSFIFVVNCCFEHCLKISYYIIQNRQSLLFRKSVYMREIESANHLLASLCTCLEHLKTLHEWSDPGDLFPSNERTAEELFEKADTINQYSFYGRCLGFQFCESIQPVLKFISICMAGFSEAFYSNGGRLSKATNSMWTSGKFFLNPELRARRIVNISQNSNVDFCKAFWFLAESELLQTLPSVIGSGIKINKIITIPPEPLKMLNTTTNQMIDIPVPSSHIGPGPVTARLLSFHKRNGMIGERSSNKTLEPSKSLIFHCHGGGFVAQSSKSHEIYLREWATVLNVPILSIDYSLAPEAPFPRALEEVFYAYCWCLNNAELLGSTCERIILAGDSAGANLNIGCALKAIEMNIRIPDGLFLAYCPVLVSFVPSPGRLLCLMDPLLPFGFMMRCLKAYASPNPKVLEQNRQQLLKVNEIKYANKKSISASSSSHQSFFSLSQTNENDKNVTFTNFETTPDISRSFGNDASSLWDAVNKKESLLQDLQLGSNSDSISDTLADASMRSHTIGNTDLFTPDESNGTSFEEDSQPITIQNPMEFFRDIKETELSFGVEALEGVLPTADNLPHEELPMSSAQYVTKFIDKYAPDNGAANESDNVNHSDNNLIFEMGKEAITIHNLQEKIQKAAENFAASVQTKINNLTGGGSSNITTPNSSELLNNNGVINNRKNLDALFARSPSDEFIFNVPRDPYLSPYWASDNLLKQMPMTKIVTIVLDPCLDDCVMFAKKLKRLGNVGVQLDILDGLPHGFLNFSMFSKEAHDGSKLCMKRIAELLEIDIVQEEHKNCC